MVQAASDRALRERPPSLLTAYRAVLGLRLREVAQYRAAAWAGVFTQLVFGFIIFMSLSAFSASNPARAPMTHEQLLGYVWLGQAFLALLPWNTDKDIAAMVRQGTIAYELVRPLDVYAFWFCRTLGWRLSATALRCVPLLVLVGLVFPAVGLGAYALPPPPSVASGVAFLLALALAVPLGVAITMLVQVTILWSLKVDGLSRLMPGIVMLCGGMIVPLPMFPESLQRLLFLLPFRGTVDVPFRAYSGSLSPEAALASLPVSALWLGLLVWAGRRLLRRGLKHVAVHGG